MPVPAVFGGEHVAGAREDAGATHAPWPRSSNGVVDVADRRRPDRARSAGRRPQRNREAATLPSAGASLTALTVMWRCPWPTRRTKCRRLRIQRQGAVAAGGLVPRAEGDAAVPLKLAFGWKYSRVPASAASRRTTTFADAQGDRLQLAPPLVEKCHVPLVMSAPVSPMP